MKQIFLTSPVIMTGKWVWHNFWRLMMSNLAPSDDVGNYQRPPSHFRNSVQEIEANRYTLYGGITCPWAHRTFMVRALKDLEDVIEVNLLVADVNEGGWIMEEVSENCRTLRELYQLAEPNYEGRCTVPVLWDKKTKTIINNESAEIIIILNEKFNQFSQDKITDLYPEKLREKIDLWNEKIYHNINNGVYRCGFAQTQFAYEKACLALFKTLDEIDLHLANNRYLCGDDLTLGDVRLFTTLIRFDSVYFHLFKCSLKRIKDYTNLNRYLQDINNLPKIKDTYDLSKIKEDYYHTLFPLNPSGIVPLTTP